MQRPNAFAFQGVEDILPYSFKLAVTFSTAKYKIGGKGALLLYIKQDNILGLLFRSRFNRQMCYLFRFQERTFLLIDTIVSLDSRTTK
jgi:hypothetical protein